MTYMGEKPLNGSFTIIMHVIQLIMIVVGGTVAFMNLKGDVQIIDSKVTTVSKDVDRITEYLGVWNNKDAQR